MKPGGGTPRHRETQADRRWTVEEQGRILTELRRLSARLGTMKEADVALEQPIGTVRRFLTDGYPVTPRIANALAGHLGTTADDIAAGRYVRPAA